MPKAKKTTLRKSSRKAVKARTPIPKPKKPRKSKRLATTESYEHTEAQSVLRPEVGLQAQFKKKKPAREYRYDRSLDPSLSWDLSADRELAEWLIDLIERAAKLPAPHRFDAAQQWKGDAAIQIYGLDDATAMLKRLCRPFLNWAGKAERTSFSVPTLPLFVHERLSTEAILKTLQGHKRDQQMSLLFADPQVDIADRALRAYEHKDKWVNRMILGDSLVVMNSLLQYESLGGQVQMIYMDPPYGVKFGSNFQPFVRKRDVTHNDDADLTREPEMVQAYRDTWELGLHSYLTYMRDRLLLSKELLTPSGSIFVQIGEENLHHVCELMDEIFGDSNRCRVIAYVTTSFQADRLLPNTTNYLLWYSRDVERLKPNQLFKQKQLGDQEAGEYKWVRLADGSTRALNQAEWAGTQRLPEGSRAFRYGPLTSQGYSESGSRPFTYKGKSYSIGNNQHWKTSHEGLQALADKGMLIPRENSLSYFMFLDDFPVTPMGNVWTDMKWGFDAGDKAYVVQTNAKVVQRCMLLTTSPGDLVLDPTCGSGTTAYVAEQWGRRWITADVSRVPLALARQRLLTATYDYYQLMDDARGVDGGFKYERKQNSKGEEVGGIVPHITLKSIAQNEKPKEEVLVDRPNVVPGIVRVSGPFTLEATLPLPADWNGEGTEQGKERAVDIADFKTRMIEVLRKVATLRVGNKSVQFKRIKPPARSLSLDAEGEQLEPTLADVKEEAAIQKSLDTNGGMPVAFVFGPENGAVTDRQVMNSAQEAKLRGYKHLYVIGFAFQDSARKFIANCAEIMEIPASAVSATMDLQMHDLLKDQRSSQVFAVTGHPDVRLIKLKEPSKEGDVLYRVELLGLDVFDPVTMEIDHKSGNDVPAWFLDTDYNDLSFWVGQAFFPRTSAWDNLKRSLKGQYEDAVWDHLAGNVSEPFTAGDNKQIAVKVIDDRGNELMIVKKLSEAEKE